MKKLDNVIPKDEYAPFLQDAPLYKSIAFEYSNVLDEALPHLCEQISIICPNCKNQVIFHFVGSRPGYSMQDNTFYPEQRFFHIDFECTDRSCRCKKTYFIHCHHLENQLILTKCGEWPSLAPRVSKGIFPIISLTTLAT